MDFFGGPKIGHFWSTFFLGVLQKRSLLRGQHPSGACNFIGAKFFGLFFGLCFFIPLLDGPGRLHCFQGFVLPKMMRKHKFGVKYKV